MLLNLWLVTIIVILYISGHTLNSKASDFMTYMPWRQREVMWSSAEICRIVMLFFVVGFVVNCFRIY